MRSFGKESLTVRGTVARERIALAAYRDANPGTLDAPLSVVNLNSAWHFGANKPPSLATIHTSGDAPGAASHTAGVRTGTNALVLEGAYYARENDRPSAQYTSYSKLHGGRNNASDNNTIHPLAWLVF